MIQINYLLHQSCKRKRIIVSTWKFSSKRAFFFMNSWQNEKFEIIVMMMIFYRKCSTLFDTLLSWFEQNSMRFSLMITQNEQKKNEIVIKVDKNHKHVIAIDRLKIKYCKKKLQISTRASNFLMTTFFKFLLKKVFAQNYHMSNVVFFEFHFFQWCKKIAFIFKCVLLR